jgi:hypothetical protein
LFLFVLGTEEIVKKSLKISKGESESVYRRRTDNTMAKKYKRTNNDLQKIRIKLNIFRLFPFIVETDLNPKESLKTLKVKPESIMAKK